MSSSDYTFYDPGTDILNHMMGCSNNSKNINMKQTEISYVIYQCIDVQWKILEYLMQNQQHLN